MDELVPWALGLLVGIIYPRPAGVLRGALLAALVVALGASVTVLNGEWSQSPGFALIDIGQTWLAASIAMFARRYLVPRVPDTADR